MVGVDVGIGREGVREDAGLSELVVNPLAAVLDHHETGDDLTVDGLSGEDGFLRSADIFTVRCVEVAVGHQQGSSFVVCVTIARQR